MVRKQCDNITFLKTAIIHLLLLPRLRTKAEPCSVCHGGETITRPNQEISIPNFESVKDCATLDSVIPMIQNDTVECEFVRDIGTLCGCPRKSSSKTCTLCADGSKVSKPYLEVPFFFQDKLHGMTPTCELLEAYLDSMDQKGFTCSFSQKVLSDYCGCSTASTERDESSSSPPCQLCRGGEAIAFPNKTLDLEGFPLETCGELEAATSRFLREGSETCNSLQSVGPFCGCKPAIEDGCTLCLDGSQAPNSSRPIDILDEEFGFVPNCGLLEAALRSERSDSKQCRSNHLFGTHCGCPTIENHCHFCDSNETFPPEYLDREIPQFERIAPFTPTCGLMETFQYQLPQNSKLCRQVNDLGWRCGCNDGNYEYLGADSLAKKKALAWVPRGSGALSVCGSLYIIYNILSQRKKKLGKTYPQIMLAIGVFDIFNSVGWALSTLPMPEYDEFGHETPYYGAKGTQGTCTAQGFFIQLGYTGMFYNLSLVIYYYAVIVLGWKETRLKKRTKWLHVVPLTVGLVLAFAGVPFYDTDASACYMPLPAVVVFGIIPISAVILFASFIMILIYCKVRQNSRASNKWRLQNNAGNNNSKNNKAAKKSRLERQVFWQSVFYLCSFYVSWPIVTASYLVDDRSNFVFWLLVVALCPIQGFNNCIVYIRPRIMRYFEERRRRRTRRRAEHPTSTSEVPDDSEAAAGPTTYLCRLIRAPIEWCGSIVNWWYLRGVRPGRDYANSTDNEEYIEPDIAIADDGSEAGEYAEGESDVSEKALPEANNVGRILDVDSGGCKNLETKSASSIQDERTHMEIDRTEAPIRFDDEDQSSW